MVSIRAMGLWVNDPRQVQPVLQNLSPLFQSPAEAQGFGVATCVDDGVLLSRVPSRSADMSLSAAFKELRGYRAILQFRGKNDLLPTHKTTLENNMGPYRLKRFACAVLGGPTTLQEADAQREKLKSELPDFLLRSLAGYSEGEAFFLSILAKCYQDRVFENETHIAQTVSAVLKAILGKEPADTSRGILFAFDDKLVLATKNMSAAQVTVDQVETAVGDKNRERLKQFRGKFVFLGVDGDPTKLKELPKGMGCKLFKEDTCQIYAPIA